MKKQVTFKMNDKAYATDEEVLNILRSIAPAAKVSGDSSAVSFLMELGLMTGRIVELN